MVLDVKSGMGNVWEGARYYRYPYIYEIRSRSITESFDTLSKKLVSISDIRLSIKNEKGYDEQTERFVQSGMLKRSIKLIT